MASWEELVRPLLIMWMEEQGQYFGLTWQVTLYLSLEPEDKLGIARSVPTAFSVFMM